MAQIPVILPSGASNPIKVVSSADETGATYIQVIQLGEEDQGGIIIELLDAIRDELQALRLVTSQAANIPYELTERLIEQQS